jgi:hypothetical protein
MTSPVQPQQVTSLPLGSGAGSPSKTAINNINSDLTMMNAQSGADSQFDPPPPPPTTQPTTVSTFCSGPSSPIDLRILMVVGGLLVVYGIIAK